MSDLTQQLSVLQRELRGYFDKNDDRQTEFERRMDAMECRYQRPSFGRGSGNHDLAQAIWDSGEFKDLQSKGRGKAIIAFSDKSLSDFREEKTLLTSTVVGAATSGVLPIQRYPGIIPEARRQLYLQDLLTRYPCSNTSVDFVKVSSFSKVVSPQTEGDVKGESEMKFTTGTAGVKTLATTIPASRQVIEDLAGLRSFIEGSLVFSVMEEIEDQILSGDGTGQNFTGMTTGATAFDTGLLTASDGWEFSDIVARSVQQLAAADEVAPDFVCVNPQDWWTIRLMKDTTGQYIYGRPDRPAPTNLFGLTVLPTTAMTQGYCLVGSSSPRCAAIFERTGLVVEVSTEHSDFFVRNQLMFRCEQRLAFATFRPAAYIYSSLTQSPA